MTNITMSIRIKNNLSFAKKNLAKKININLETSIPFDL